MNKKTDNFDYELIEIGYYDKVYKQNKGVQSKWHHQKFNSVRSLLGNYRSHLDIGCGPGTFIGTLDPNRYSVGVDISEAQIDFAQKNHGTNTHKFEKISPHQKLPFGNNTFDMITSIELIEHITYQDGHFLLQEAYRVLSPGGKIILTTPNYGSLWPILEYFVNKFSRVSYKDQHIQHYKMNSLRDLFKQFKFTEIDINTILFLSPFLAGFSWKFSDHIYQLESGCIGKRMGFLLIAQAMKG